MTPRLAERVRTVLRVAESVRVHAAGVRGEVDLYGVDPDGSVVLVIAETDPLVLAVRDAVDDPPVLLTATDLCPVPVADRQRGRVELTGRIHEPPPELRRELALVAADREDIGRLLDIGYGHTVLVVEVWDAALFDGTTRFVDAVSGAEYAAAVADPLAGVEAALLDHLLTVHPAELAQLASLVPGDAGDRITPIRLDRYGLVFRAGRTDHRLAFAEPVTCPRQLPAQMRALLARAGYPSAATVRSGGPNSPG